MLYCRIPLCLSAIIMLLSCTRPSSIESFVSQSDRDSLGRYVFSLDLTDSIHTHDIYFYTMIDAPDVDFNTMPGALELGVALLSPSGRKYSETAFLDKCSFTSAGPYSRRYYIPYRKGFRPAEYGVWHLDVLIKNEDSYPGLRGLGVRLARNVDQTVCKEMRETDIWEKTN